MALSAFQETNDSAADTPTQGAIRTNSRVAPTRTERTGESTSQSLGAAYLNAPRPERMMPGEGAKVTMFDALLPAGVRQALGQHINRNRIG
ncbi:hypothetical protein FBZ83_113120 [Azospirillum brasilense]|uniref:Uncharacterized protein n=2 Tax=Azospirillum brasilense TaxID=192 RepID=A0A560C0L5_AZOBR|nr:hypothetical protein FBZ83_113120 [Azospirillum brasilense]